MMLMAIVIFAILILGLTAMKQSGSVVPLISALGAIAMVILALMYWVTKHSPRKRVRTWLAFSLLPIEPTGEEIDRARREMQASRIKAGDCIRSDKVLAKIVKMKAKPHPMM